AIGGDGELAGEVALAGAPTPRHAEQVAPAVRYLCDETGIELRQLAAIAVGVGPGLFTGLRVGVTTAKAMAQGLRIPVVCVPSLDLLAYPLRSTQRVVAAVLDARRHEVYFALYLPVPGGVQRVSGYEIGSPDDLVGELAARADEVLLAGEGALLYRDRFATLDRAELAGPGFAWPRAAALLELATARYEREDFCSPSEVQPMYLRKSDAEIETEREPRREHAS
ncbi:MAG: tRNA (adenosine(37)-N6)-threonylcarbamoyltransferase complex dimerization subunit type 1 TsaB, partial [Actinobacteria bacterium]|nr:tRNA (adenosine(37)-N6)-threonylcarbamoyltransferase complex dimerization subunit type 1 TsaB [Actinomycetota bacterium]